MPSLCYAGRPFRVGIAGARGIGRHQAKWFAHLGCEVGAIYGSTPDSAAAAAAALRELFAFEGRVECDWDAFVAAPDLDAVAVCSPPAAHAANTLSALRAGKHVLCEKPMVWDWRVEPDRWLRDAASMVAAAHEVGRVLAVNAQYPAAIPPLLELFRTVHGREPQFRGVLFRMETGGPPRSPHDAAEVWADLGPHPLAFFDRLFPGGQPDLASVRREGNQSTLLLHLDWLRSGRRVPVTMELRRVQDRSAVRREVVVDDWSVAYMARNVLGEFQSVLSAPPVEWVGEDFMRASLSRFVEAACAGDPDLALVSGAQAFRQLEYQVAIYQSCLAPGVP
jgi:predicted dehydrogenase